MKNLGNTFFFVVMALLTISLFEGSFISPDAGVTKSVQKGVTYGVSRVVDGDTVVLYKGDQEETVRFVGIDAPETEYAPTGYECFSAEATERAKELLSVNEVTFVPDASQAERDEYGRLLGYLTLPNGTDFGAQMIEGGYAKEYTFKGQPYERQAVYQEIEQLAETAGAGLWSCE